MSSIQITLPDGSQKPVEAGSRPIDIARAISPRLADAAIVAKVNGELYDLKRPLETDATVADPDDQGSRRRSRCIGTRPRTSAPRPCWSCSPKPSSASARPSKTASITISTGPTPFTPEDLEKIEAKMWELQAQNLPYERVMIPKDEGLRKYPATG